MTAQIDVKASLNLKGFEALRKGLSAGQYVKVGLFGDHKTQRTGKEPITNLELGIIHEFGSISAHIPPRSFLRMPIMEKRADILKFGASKKISELLLAGDKKKALGLLGAFAKNVIQSAFDSGGFGKWAPLKHRVGKILDDTSQMRRAIWSKVVGV